MAERQTVVVVENGPREPLSIKAALIARFGADHPLINIAACESKFRQYDEDGNAVRGLINPLDRGVFQINEHYHLARATSLGIDILTLEGNMDYAELLYKEQGTDPWNWSKPCWGG